MKIARGLALLSACLVIGCGDEEPAAVRTTPAKVTPVPTTGAPVPSPTAEIHASPTPTATPTPAATATASPDPGGAQAGDEEGIRVPVEVEVRERRITTSPEVVAAFLPLRFSIRNTLDRDVTVVVMLPDGTPVVRVDVAAAATASADSKGLRAGTAEVLSPELDPGATAILRVEPGG